MTACLSVMPVYCVETANPSLTIDGCIVWNAHNIVFGSKGSAICAQAVYFRHSTRPNVT